MRAVITGLVAVMAGVVVAGCSGGQDDAPSKADAVRTTTVTMPKSYTFEPEAISVDAGATVTWKNEDNFTHDVTIETGDDTGEHTVKPGDEVQVTFDEPGIYDYVCRFHEHDMQGTVFVT